MVFDFLLLIQSEQGGGCNHAEIKSASAEEKNVRPDLYLFGSVPAAGYFIGGG